MPKCPEITLVEVLGSADAENKVDVDTRSLLALEETCIASPTIRSPIFREADGEMDKGWDGSQIVWISMLAVLLSGSVALGEAT